MPLNKYPDRPEADVCRGCPLVATKPEAVPDELIDGVHLALSLSELQRSGSTFAYPHALSKLEWAALAGLQRGRDRAESLKAERDRIEARRKRKKNG
ncbi:MAG: hypothetical protein R2682_02015 [Pyrinomonadaceae bacterium]